MKPSEAYRHAYNCEGSSPMTVSIHASEMEADARIVLKVRELQAKAEQQTSLVPIEPRIEVNKDWVVQGIARIAANEQVKFNTRLAAYIAVGKTAGIDAFREVVAHETKPRTIAEVDAEIARHLAQLGPMIDVTPNDVNPDPVKPEPVNRKPVNAGKDRRRKPSPG